MSRHVFTPEEGQRGRDKSRQKAAENGRKGGIASGEAKRRKKTMRELLEEAFEREVENKQTGERVSLKGLTGIRIAEGCADGDARMIEIAMRLLGEDAKHIDITNSDGTLHTPSLVIEKVKEPEL